MEQGGIMIFFSFRLLLIPSQSVMNFHFRPVDLISCSNTPVLSPGSAEPRTTVRDMQATKLVTEAGFQLEKMKNRSSRKAQPITEGEEFQRRPKLLGWE